MKNVAPAKFILGDRVKIEVKKSEHGVDYTGEKSGVIDTIIIKESCGDYYQVFYKYRYRVVDNLYSCANPVWFDEEDIILQEDRPNV